MVGWPPVAEAFTKAEWKKIHKLLASDGESFGLPRSRQGFVMASWNIRKLGAVKSKSAGAWRMLAAVLSSFDLVAVQELQEDLEGLHHLMDLLGAGFDFVVSDTTGRFPGGEGMAERLAFVFRKSRVRRTEIVSDISYDRSAVVKKLFEHRVQFAAALDRWADELRDWELQRDEARAAGKDAPGKPTVDLPWFLTFIRQPHCASFEVGWGKTKRPYRFLAVNVHLHYGTRISERRQEFFGLLDWLLAHARTADRRYYPDLILLGDLNLDFDDPAEDRERIAATLKLLNGATGRAKPAEFNFPSIGVHPGEADVFRTNARVSETFDQIAILRRDPRLPAPEANRTAGTARGGFDYGVFRFVDVFARALHGRDFAALPAAKRSALIRRFEHDLSDHMPIWVVLPKPE